MFLNYSKVREQIKNQEYWEFALKYWGQIRVCDYSEVPEDTTTHYLFKANQPYVRDIFESIDWSKYVSNQWVLQMLVFKSLVIKAYKERKAEMGSVTVDQSVHYLDTEHPFQVY